MSSESTETHEAAILNVLKSVKAVQHRLNSGNKADDKNMGHKQMFASSENANYIV